MSKKICVVSEALRDPFDEGVRLYVYNFIRELSKYFDVLAFGRANNIHGEIGKYYSNAMPQNKLLISANFRRKIMEFKPDMIYYLPSAHATVYSFLRTKILKLYARNTRTILITMQPRQYSAIKKKIITFIVPDLVLAQSDKTINTLTNLGCNVRKVPSGVDLQKFSPVDATTKKILRKKHGLVDDKFIVLHVGHINRNRNIQFLKHIQYLEGVQVVIIGSSTYPEDKELVRALKKMGIIIIMNYQENIQEFYQCADCYIFPVFSDGACIEVPLSVFEAMACNLIVVTTKYGDLPNLIPEKDGFLYADTTDDIETKIQLLLKKRFEPQTRKLVEKYSWTNLVKKYLYVSLVK